MQRHFHFISKDTAIRGEVAQARTSSERIPHSLLHMALLNNLVDGGYDELDELRAMVDLVHVAVAGQHLVGWLIQWRAVSVSRDHQVVGSGNERPEARGITRGSQATGRDG
jgi:hypothetical protein